MKKSERIDLGLSVMCVVAKRDETLSDIEIADVCGCTEMTINNIKNSALKKLRGEKGLKLRGFLN